MMSMNQIFESASKHFDEESETKDKLFQQMKKLDVSLSQLQTHFSLIHQQDCDAEKLKQICLESNNLLQEASNGFKELDQVIPHGQYYRWNGMWTSKLSNLVFFVVLRDWLSTGELSDRDRVAQVLHFDQMKTIFLAVDDYLYGVCNLASELSRFCINCVTRGDMKKPFEIKAFLTDLYASFRLLNLKNDALRKRFDAVKYDVKKVEEIIYDLSIRGVKQPTE